VNVHAKSRLTLETSADTPAGDQGPGGSLPGPDAGHPLHRAAITTGMTRTGATRYQASRMGATLGATRTNDFPIGRTCPDNRQGRVRGHGLI
jgi:hypothetical protein